MRVPAFVCFFMCVFGAGRGWKRRGWFDVRCFGLITQPKTEKKKSCFCLANHKGVGKREQVMPKGINIGLINEILRGQNQEEMCILLIDSSVWDLIDCHTLQLLWSPPDFLFASSLCSFGFTLTGCHFSLSQMLLPSWALSMQTTNRCMQGLLPSHEYICRLVWAERCWDCPACSHYKCGSSIHYPSPSPHHHSCSWQWGRFELIPEVR